MDTKQHTREVATRDDLIALTRYMADSLDFTPDDIAEAVEKPWKYGDIYYEAGHRTNEGDTHTDDDDCPDAAS